MAKMIPHVTKKLGGLFHIKKYGFEMDSSQFYEVVQRERRKEYNAVVERLSKQYKDEEKLEIAVRTYFDNIHPKIRDWAIKKHQMQSDARKERNRKQREKKELKLQTK